MKDMPYTMVHAFIPLLTREMDTIILNCPESQPKSSFITPMGEYELTPVYFEIAQAPAYCQRLVNEVLTGIDIIFGCLDIFVSSPDIRTHLKHLEILFQRLREVGLKLKESECHSLKEHIQYLGHLVSGQRIELLSKKIGKCQSNAST